jgi:hypothetical protein
MAHIHSLRTNRTTKDSRNSASLLDKLRTRLIQ